MADIGPRDELYMVDPEGKIDKMDKNEHHLEYLLNFYPDEEDYNEDFWDTIFEGGWIRIELRENHRGGWDLAVNGKSLYRMKAIVRDKFLERLGRGENKVHIEEWTGSGFNPTHIFYLPAQKHELFDFVFEKAKAKFISESLGGDPLNFERGLDPKKSMRIGGDALIHQIDWELNLLDQPKDEVRIEDFISNYRGFPILIYNYGDSWQATSIMDHTGITLSPEVALRAMKRRIDTFSKKSDNKFVNKWFPGYVKESVNFERGLDPKLSMDVGREAKIRRLDKETDWGFEISHAFQVRIWDIIEYEGFLIKISQITGSDGISYYMALNNIGEPYNNTPPMYDTPEEALDWEQKYIDQYNMGL